MIKGLTQRAQRVLTVLAQEEAKRSHADKLLSEHIILAILREKGGVAYKCLQRLGINTGEMATEIEKNLPKKKGSFLLGEVPPSNRVKMLLENAAKSACAMCPRRAACCVNAPRFNGQEANRWNGVPLATLL